MPHWRVDYLGKKSPHHDTVEAASEREAIPDAAKEFNIPPARQNKIAVTPINERSRQGTFVFRLQDQVLSRQPMRRLGLAVDDPIPSIRI